jgi:UDPglucose--hexose-1-phosphate uridylyltransferase
LTAQRAATERRLDAFTGRSVLIAPARRWVGATRPGGLPEPAERCPFCPGHEADTEATVARWPAEGEWQVRVVPNKFPVVAAPLSEGEAAGVHEVGVDAREHTADLADLGPAHLAGMLGVYRDRLRALEAREGTVASFLFRNRGRRAGSSQPHPHTQLGALGWAPAEVQLRAEVARRHRAAHGEGVLAAALRRELDDGSRVLALDERFVAFCPFAPSRSFEVRIAPREAEGRFSALEDAALAGLAARLLDVMRRLRDAGLADHNLVLREPPLSEARPAWHLEVLPRTGGDAGFELLTGEMIVVVPPEEAAARLRG